MARRRIRATSRLLHLFVGAIALLALGVSAQQTTADTSNTTAVAIVPANIFAGAPIDVSTVNITAATSSSSSSSRITTTQLRGAGAGTAVGFTLTINAPSNLQWNRATVQFAKHLMFTAPVAGSSVFAPTRMLEKAPWTVDVSGGNATVLAIRLHIAECMDPPRRPTGKGTDALQIAISVPASATNPPLTGPLLQVPGGLSVELPVQTSEQTELVRIVIGAGFFLLMLVLTAAVFFCDGGASAAVELLWTLQTMLAVSSSPCARHSFYSFSTVVFWMLRTGVDARSVVPAVVHTIVMLLGIGLSLVVAARARTPQAGLRHPRIGLFFVCVFVLGGVQSSTLLTIGGVPDLDVSMDTGNRAVGFATLLIQIVAAVAFCWSGIGAPALATLRLEQGVPEGSSDDVTKQPPAPTFWTDSIWRPVTAARRSSPIAGIFGPIAHLPRPLANLANFLPFFLSLAAHLVLVVMLSVDPSNIGGCIATIATCIAIHLLFAAYVATGHSTCRSAAWGTSIALAHVGRALWCTAALVHLDCSNSAADVDTAATVLALLGMVCVGVAAIIALIATRKELVLTSNKLNQSRGIAPAKSSKNSGGGGAAAVMLGGSGKAQSPLAQQQSPLLIGVDGAHPMITLTNASIGASTTPVDSSLAPPSPQHDSPRSTTTMIDPVTGKKVKVKKKLPPLTCGTGERPASPLHGGLHSSPTFAPAMRPGWDEEQRVALARMGAAAAASPSGMAVEMQQRHALKMGGSGGGATSSSVTDALGLSGGAAAGSSGTGIALRGMQNAGVMDATTRPRAVSIESKLSSGSGGHEGPAGKRSPSSSLGPGASAVHCMRCGLPARPSPAGSGQATVCATCREQIAAETRINGGATATTSGWVIPSQTGGRDSSRHGSPNASSVVVLPSWEAQQQQQQHHPLPGAALSASGRVGSGIVHLPSWSASPPPLPTAVQPVGNRQVAAADSLSDDEFL